MVEGLYMVPTLSKASAESLPEREKEPGIYWEWTIFESDKKLRRDWVSVKDLGSSYNTGIERVIDVRKDSLLNRSK